MKKRIVTSFMALFCTVSVLHAQSFLQQIHIDWKETNISQVRQLITNLGDMGGHPAAVGYPGLVISEFPAGSGQEHIGEGGIWVGGITPTGDTLETKTVCWAPGPYFWDCFPSDAAWDSIWVVNRGQTANIPYWPNYKAHSDQDFVLRYNDYGPVSLKNPHHKPLYLEFIETVWSWSGPPGLNDVLVYNFYIWPTRFPIKNAWLTYWLDPNVGSIAHGANWYDDYTKFYPSLNMGAGLDAPGGVDGTAYSPIGLMLFPPAGTSLDSVRESFIWGSQATAPGFMPPTDVLKYKAVSSGEIMQNQVEPSGSSFLFSMGPFNIAVGDTIHWMAAEIFGKGEAGMLKNAELVKRLAAQNFRVPSPPPEPPLKVIPGNHQITLNWTPTSQDDPETYTDPNRADGDPKPFGGYRVYKSTVSATGPWTMLAEYDVKNGGTGVDSLPHSFTDRLLLNNVDYYYSVTAFSKPDTVFPWPSVESSINANAVDAVPGTPPPSTVGKVSVVPNPYRGDISYYSYNPPWEKPDPSLHEWIEQDRRLQFINLPPRCEIKIYTLVGELVATLEHDNPNVGYKDWNLTSDVGQAISSGIYLYTVRDLSNGQVQVGKFVVIK